MQTGILSIFTADFFENAQKISTQDFFNIYVLITSLEKFCSDVDQFSCIFQSFRGAEDAVKVRA